MVLLEWVNKIVCGDALEILKRVPSEFVDMAMTSPPYWGLRNYGDDTCKIWDGDLECKHEWIESGVYYSQPHHGIGSKNMAIPCVTKEALNKPKPESVFCHKCGAWYGQLGLEPLPDMYVKHLLQIFQELKRILRPTGSFYLNMGDTYAGSRRRSHDYRTDKCKNLSGREQHDSKYGKPVPQATASVPRKSLCMVPERVALAMISDGWILRNKIIWHKPNPIPSSVKDRLNSTWEYLFHFVKKQKYFYNLDAIREPCKISQQNLVHIIKIHQLAKGRQRNVYNGKFNTDQKEEVSGVNSKSVQEFTKALRDTAKEYIVKNALSRKEIKYIREYCHNYSGNPRGKNPGDFVKHDIGVGRTGNFSYSDPLHNKAYNPDGKNPEDVFEITTKAFRGAHFAVYPEELCEAPIKAGCPEHVCKKCGQPKRQVLKTKPNPNAFNIRIRDVKEGRIKFEDRKASEAEVKQYQKKKYQSRPKEVVIAKGCKCDSGFKPGIVLDPFCGAGTTCLVAKKLGRQFIGIDISETYCRMARKRLAKGH